MAVVPTDLIFAVFANALRTLLMFLLPLAAGTAVVAVSVGLVARQPRATIGIMALVSFTTAFVALTVGYLAGSSRETVAGDVLPVVMSGIGALAVYAVINRAIPVPVASGLSILIALHLLAGVLLGAAFREYGPPNFQAVQPPAFTGEIEG